MKDSTHLLSSPRLNLPTPMEIREKCRSDIYLKNGAQSGLSLTFLLALLHDKHPLAPVDLIVEGTRLRSMYSWPNGQWVVFLCQLVPCRSVSRIFSEWVPYRRLDNLLSSLAPLLWHTSAPSGHGPTKAANTARCTPIVRYFELLHTRSSRYPSVVFEPSLGLPSLYLISSPSDLTIVLSADRIRPRFETL